MERRRGRAHDGYHGGMLYTCIEDGVMEMWSGKCFGGVRKGIFLGGCINASNVLCAQWATILNSLDRKVMMIMLARMLLPQGFTDDYM